jgi:uncharacterized protein (TIGR02118 family)
MVKVSVLYPNSETTKFDMDYYLAHHIPLVQKLLGAALRGVFVEQGISGGQADSSPTYVAMGHLMFDSVEDYQASFGPHAPAIVGDIPHYTDSQPTIQISEVKLAPANE